MSPVEGRRVIYGSILIASALLFAAGAWNFGSHRVSLLEYSDSSNLLSAERAVAEAQARVEKDMARAARIRRSNSLYEAPFERLYNGPQSKEKAFPAPTAIDQATLESPNDVYTKTPRLKRHNRFGPNNRYCAGGNCDNLDAAGVVTDRWPIDVYSGVPWLSTDPDADPRRTRNLNQRAGEFSGELRADSYHPPVQWGIGAAPEENPDGYNGQGTVAPADRGVAALEEGGVNHDNWPMDLYSGFPWPSWDKTQFDQQKHRDLLPSADPIQTIGSIRDSSAPLRDAGVTVDRLPTDDRKREYNSVDGLLDKLVPIAAVPKYTKGGAAPQDMPESFLLREHPDLAGPQPEEDDQLGVEVEAPAAKRPRNVWDSLGCGPQGCLGGREGEEFERPDSDAQ